MNVKMLTVGPFQSNCFIVSCEETLEAIIIDAGDDADRILSYVDDEKLQVKMVFNTHAHIDHVSGLADVVSTLAVPVVMHESELPVYEGLAQSAMMFGLPVPKSVKIDRFVKGGDVIAFGKVSGKVIDTPGHSPGGVTLTFGGEPPQAFVGDVLFRGSIGRTDLPGSDHTTMIETLRNVIMALPDDTVAHSGHGPSTTIGIEKASNPFLLSL